MGSRDQLTHSAGPLPSPDELRVIYYWHRRENFPHAAGRSPRALSTLSSLRIRPRCSCGQQSSGRTGHPLQHATGDWGDWGSPHRPLFRLITRSHQSARKYDQSGRHPGDVGTWWPKSDIDWDISARCGGRHRFCCGGGPKFFGRSTAQCRVRPRASSQPPGDGRRWPRKRPRETGGAEQAGILRCADHRATGATQPTTSGVRSNLCIRCIMRRESRLEGAQEPACSGDLMNSMFVKPPS